MKLVSSRSIREVTYKYENEMHLDLHKQVMERDGFRVVRDHPYFQKDLVVTYQKSRIDDGIARL